MVLNVVALSLSVIAIGISYRQVRLTRHVTDGEVVSELLSKLYDPASRDRRSTVYGLKDRALSDWTPAEYLAAEQVGADYGRIGFLLKHRYLSSEDMLDLWGPNAIAMYQIIEPLIERRRTPEHSPEQFIYFEWLARRAVLRRARQAWWHRHGWRRTVNQTNDLKRRTQMSLVGRTRPM